MTALNNSILHLHYTRKRIHNKLFRQAKKAFCWVSFKILYMIKKRLLLQKDVTRVITNFSNKDKQFTKIYSWIGILIVCAAAIPLHFLYNWTGGLALVGMFTPINESIWEHLNLVFWPLLLWWGLGYLIFRNKKMLSRSRWFTAGAISIFISMFFIVAWYYIWSGGLGIENSLTNLSSLFIAVPIGQLVAIHVYRVVKPRTIYLILSSLFLIAFAGMFIWFTFRTPDFPIFIPPN